MGFLASPSKVLRGGKGWGRARSNKKSLFKKQGKGHKGGGEYRLFFH